MAISRTHELEAAARTVQRSAHAVGAALASVEVYVEPSIARAVQAEQNMYAGIEAEFGMLASGEAGRVMGSRSTAPRNLAATAHRDGALVAVRRGNHLAYPGFQFGPDGQPLPVIRRLREIADACEWSETGLVQWLCSPTTYLDGSRPIDHLGANPERVVSVASEALAASW